MPRKKQKQKKYLKNVTPLGGTPKIPTGKLGKMVLYFNQIRLIVPKWVRPKLEKKTKRAIWVKCLISIDGKQIECHFEKQYGANLHFEYDNHWYKIAISGEYYDEIKKQVAKYSINPLQQPVFTTKCFHITGIAKATP